MKKSYKWILEIWNHGETFDKNARSYWEERKVYYFKTKKEAIAFTGFNLPLTFNGYRGINKNVEYWLKKKL